MYNIHNLWISQARKRLNVAFNIFATQMNFNDCTLWNILNAKCWIALETSSLLHLVNLQIYGCPGLVFILEITTPTVQTSITSRCTLFQALQSSCILRIWSIWKSLPLFCRTHCASIAYFLLPWDALLVITQ